MAATAFLRSQDCLRRHQPNTTFRNQNHNFTHQRRFKSIARDDDDHHQTIPVPVMGHVRILKRGEALPKTTASEYNKTTASEYNKTTALVGGGSQALPKTTTFEDSKTTPFVGGGSQALPKTTTTEDSNTTPFVGGDEGLILSSTGRLGPEPETVLKEIKVPDIYSGVGLLVESPSPRSLPFPGFFAKNEKNNNAATNDLRRLLKLDMAA